MHRRSVSFWRGPHQPACVIFGIDQSTVCRYLQFADPVLEEVLPTAGRAAAAVARAPARRLKELVPDNSLIVDSVHTPVQRPKNRDAQEAYSGKKKRCTATPR